MAGATEAVDSLSRLIVALEGEERRTEDGAESDPKRFVPELLNAVRQLSDWPEAKARLLARRDELERRFAPGGRFDVLRERLRPELAATTPVYRPEGTSEADASETLENWRAALGEQSTDLFRNDPALATRELQEDFETWQLPLSTHNALFEFVLELTEAACENTVSPWRGVWAFAALTGNRRLTLRGVEMLFIDEDERRPTVTELLATSRWLVSLAKTLAEGVDHNRSSAKRGPSKRRRQLIEPSLTAKQLEAMQIVSECKGDLAEAARRLGKDRSTIKQHYDAATAKLGKHAVKHSTKQHATDRRGQANIATDSDKRH